MARDDFDPGQIEAGVHVEVVERVSERQDRWVIVPRVDGTGPIHQA
jgi:hypothetical protein